MPSLECLKCKRATNTSFSDWADAPIGFAHQCYAAWENERWVKGCGYNNAGYLKPFIDYIINNQYKEKKEKREKEFLDSIEEGN